MPGSNTLQGGNSIESFGIRFGMTSQNWLPGSLQDVVVVHDAGVAVLREARCDPDPLHDGRQHHVRPLVHQLLDRRVTLGPVAVLELGAPHEVEQALDRLRRPNHTEGTYDVRNYFLCLASLLCWMTQDLDQIFNLIQI